MANEKRVIKTIRRVMPAVISIVVSKSLKELEKELPSIYPQLAPNSPFLKVPPEKIDAHGMVQIGGGSGFIVDDAGIILTNKHVIAEPHANYTVITNDNERYEAEVLARDPVNDVAILKIKPKRKLPTVKLGNSDSIKLGQSVLAIGNALGIFKNTVSMGIISGLSRSISAQADPASPPQEMRGLIQTDAAINPGNSGGPLVDLEGRAVGINAAIVSGAQNISFAIPIKSAERDLKDLKKYGRIRRPLLGLRYLTLNDELKEKLGLPVNYGAFIVKEHPLDEAVIPGSPAAKAGLKEKDIILEWNDEKITSDKSIHDFLENCKVGENIKVKVLRGKKNLDIKLVLAERK